MKYLLLAAALALASATPANAFTCDQVRWAIANLPTSVINGYKKLASSEDISKARACLASPSASGMVKKKRKHRHG